MEVSSSVVGAENAAGLGAQEGKHQHQPMSCNQQTNQQHQQQQQQQPQQQDGGASASSSSHMVKEIGKYTVLSHIGQGTFSFDAKAQNRQTGQQVAIKFMKKKFDNIEQVNQVREMKALKLLSPHPNIIKLEEVLFRKSRGTLALVFELMSMNLYDLIKNKRQPLPSILVKKFMFQLLTAVDHMHSRRIFHRDIKPENVLIDNTQRLKLADFGSCCTTRSNPPFTEYISTRWYRAPECLLTSGFYNQKMDIWGVGCVMFEIVALFPLFPGNNEIDMITRIHRVIGTPSSSLIAKLTSNSKRFKDVTFSPMKGTGIAKLIPHASPECINLIECMVTYDSDDRYSAREALQHPYFDEIRSLFSPPNTTAASGVDHSTCAPNQQTKSTEACDASISSATGASSSSSPILNGISNSSDDKHGCNSGGGGGGLMAVGKSSQIHSDSSSNEDDDFASSGIEQHQHQHQHRKHHKHHKQHKERTNKRPNEMSPPEDPHTKSMSALALPSLISTDNTTSAASSNMTTTAKMVNSHHVSNQTAAPHLETVIHRNHQTLAPSSLSLPFLHGNANGNGTNTHHSSSQRVGGVKPQLNLNLGSPSNENRHCIIESSPSASASVGAAAGTGTGGKSEREKGKKQSNTNSNSKSSVSQLPQIAEVSALSSTFPPPSSSLAALSINNNNNNNNHHHLPSNNKNSKSTNHLLPQLTSTTSSTSSLISQTNISSKASHNQHPLQAVYGPHSISWPSSLPPVESSVEREGGGGASGQQEFDVNLNHRSHNNNNNNSNNNNHHHHEQQSQNRVHHLPNNNVKAVKNRNYRQRKQNAQQQAISAVHRLAQQGGLPAGLMHSGLLHTFPGSSASRHSLVASNSQTQNSLLNSNSESHQSMSRRYPDNNSNNNNNNNNSNKYQHHSLSLVKSQMGSSSHSSSSSSPLSSPSSSRMLPIQVQQQMSHHNSNVSSLPNLLADVLTNSHKVKGSSSSPSSSSSVSPSSPTSSSSPTMSLHQPQQSHINSHASFAGSSNANNTSDVRSPHNRTLLTVDGVPQYAVVMKASTNESSSVHGVALSSPSDQTRLSKSLHQAVRA